MKGLPRKGDDVRFEDPWFYKGEGLVVQVQTNPHEAVLVYIERMDDELHQNWVDRSVWVLPSYITIIEK